MLQTRSGKRTGRASVKIAVDMVNEGLITESEALELHVVDLVARDIDDLPGVGVRGAGSRAVR